MTWASGQKLHRDQYEIKQQLGQGNFAITYLAEDRDAKKVVIKTLDSNLLNQLSNEDRDRLKSGFADESRKLAICKHPNIVQVIDTFESGDLKCMVMEYIQGDNLAKIVQPRVFLPEKEALDYIQQIGKALIVVHEQGFLHRDVKPENIILRAGTHQVVLINFDLARRFVDNPVSSRGNLVNKFTPIELYSNSPRQQARRKPWTDIYSLAATLYFLLTGKLPESAIERQDNNKRLIPPKELNDKISDRVNQAILHAMELQPDNRPETVEDWLKELGFKTAGFSLPKLPWTQPLWAWILEIMGVLALFAALISGVKDGTDLFKDWFPDKSAPTNPPTQQRPSSSAKPQNR
ncbi:MAG: serine/threonine protein kinase [Nostoc sp. EfeVER01]|uniref:serine/threonine protein kinase n=1 Tax=unclassified Nostoc TaxID=2593658 RepID=UPI002AD3B604|nr:MULTISPECIES: serine/threonine-protein kinase [unclassified Nostoc]MDZ7943519.1 serine/threonine-protein kinase [Nostoc sp. EfeVER01]MDZ7990990.1 serine/threonine-protein kinase [Nostoc sp. EspVER01]